MADGSEEKDIKKRILKCLGGFLVSFALIFGGMYFYMTRFVVPNMGELVAEDAEEAAADSTQVDSSLVLSKPDLLWEEEVEPEEETQEMDAEEEEGQKQKRLRQLAKIYATMKPQEAAVSMVKLDDEMITEVLLGMRDREAGKLLAALSKLQPDRTARVIRRMVQ